MNERKLSIGQMREMEAAIVKLVKPYGYEVESMQREILAFGPTITDNIEVRLVPVNESPPDLGIHVSDGVGAKSKMGG